MKFIKTFYFLTAVGIIFISHATCALEAECSLRVVLANKTVNRTQFHVYNGDTFHNSYNSSLDALKAISNLQEEYYCLPQIGSLPNCKIEFYPASGHNREILSFYAIYSGKTLVDTVKTKSQAKSIEDRLKDVRFCN